MNDNETIKIRAYNSETSHTEETGETISVYTLAKSLTLENFVLNA